MVILPDGSTAHRGQVNCASSLDDIDFPVIDVIGQRIHGRLSKIICVLQSDFFGKLVSLSIQ